MAAPSNDVVGVAVHLDHAAVQDRRQLVDALFSGIEFPGSDEVRWHGDSFTAVKSDALRLKLFALFGANLSLGIVDQNIRRLVQMELGWLQSSSEDSVIITSGEINADLDNICQLVLSSLSVDIVNKVKILLTNIHTMLSADSWFGQTRQVDVNVYTKNGSDIICVHARYMAETKRSAVKVLFLGGSKRSVRISFSLRKIGISQTFVDDLVSDEPTISVQDGQLHRVLRLPEPSGLTAVRSSMPSRGSPSKEGGGGGSRSISGG